MSVKFTIEIEKTSESSAIPVVEPPVVLVEPPLAVPAKPLSKKVVVAKPLDLRRPEWIGWKWVIEGWLCECGYLQEVLTIETGVPLPPDVCPACKQHGHFLSPPRERKKYESRLGRPPKERFEPPEEAGDD